MAHYRRVGDVPAKRHTQFRDAGGELLREELMGEEGFSADSSLLYHRGIPSAMVDARIWELPDLGTTPNHPLMPRHLKLHDLFAPADPATRTCGSPTPWPPSRARCTATRSATSACSSRPGRAWCRRCSASCRSSPVI